MPNPFLLAAKQVDMTDYPYFSCVALHDNDGSTAELNFYQDIFNIGYSEDGSKHPTFEGSLVRLYKKNPSTYSHRYSAKFKSRVKEIRVMALILADILWEEERKKA